MQDVHDRHEAQAEAGTVSAVNGAVSGALLTADQVQRLLDLDRSTVYRMASDGRLPALKIGRQWRFPAERIRSLLALERPVPEAGQPRPALPRTVAQPVIDVAAQSLGVMMVVTDMAGRPVTDVANPNAWFSARAGDATVLDACTAEWRVLADDLDFEPHFRTGHLGFECARSFIRSGDRLIGMVLAGGVATADQGDRRPDLHQLDPDQRHQVLATLPKIATVLSRAAVESAPTGDHASAGSPPQSRSME